MQGMDLAANVRNDSESNIQSNVGFIVLTIACGTFVGNVVYFKSPSIKIGTNQFKVHSVKITKSNN